MVVLSVPVLGKKKHISKKSLNCLLNMLDVSAIKPQKPLWSGLDMCKGIQVETVRQEAERKIKEDIYRCSETEEEVSRCGKRRCRRWTERIPLSRTAERRNAGRRTTSFTPVRFSPRLPERWNTSVAPILGFAITFLACFKGGRNRCKQQRVFWVSGCLSVRLMPCW